MSQHINPTPKQTDIASLNSKRMYDTLPYLSQGDLCTVIKNYVSSGVKSGMFNAYQCTNAPSTSAVYKIRFEQLDGSSIISIEAWEPNPVNHVYIGTLSPSWSSINWYELALNDNLNAFSGVSFTPESGINSDNLFIRRYGRVVCVNGAITADTAFTTNQLLGNIQAGNWPVSGVRTLAGVAEHVYSVGDIAYVAVGSDGGVRITAKSGNTYKNCYFSISYIVQS